MPGLIQFKGCQPCELRHEWPFLRHPQMPMATPTEPSPYRVLIVGEAPGETEDDYGKPFVGTTGRILRKYLPGNWENKVYWSNTVRCRPQRNREPTLREIECCSFYQERDLNILKPHAILALGDVALKYFWPNAWVSGARNLPFPIKLSDGTSTWCMGAYDPSFILHQEKKDYDTKETTNPALPVFKNDLKNFFSLVPFFAENPPPIYQVPKKEILYPQSELEALNIFDRMIGPPGHDIETVKLKPWMRDARIITSAFSDGKLTMAFPVNWPGLPNKWGIEAQRKIILKCKERGIPWIAQNAHMEYSWLWYDTQEWDLDFHDTEVLSRLIHKRKGFGKLEITSRLYLGVDVKQFHNMDKDRLLDYPMEQVLEYNALDAWATRCIWDNLYPMACEIPEIIDNYNRILPAIKSTTAMQLKGLTVDIKESEKLDKETYTKLHEYENQAKNMPIIMEFEKKENKRFFLSQPETVGHVIVQYCGLQLPKTAKSQQYSTAEDDLTPLAGQHPLVDLVLDYREMAKLKSTYIDPILSGAAIGLDGLLHPSYTTCHTATYRLSSEGPNIQNFPKRKNKHIRRQIIAPPGYILAAWDYGQLEGRVIAMYSRDKALGLFMTEQAKAIVANDEVLIKKYDIHYKWLNRIIELYPQYMDRLARNSGETKDDKILKAGRTIIKTDFVFASFYGSVARSIANRTQIPLDIVEQVLNREFWIEYSATKEWVEGQFRKYAEEGQVASLNGRYRNEILPGNEVINTPVQGLAAELVIEAQNALFFKAMKEDPNFMPRINIHDDLAFLLPDNNDLFQYIQVIGQEIVKPRFPFITVPLMSECRVGYNWAELESVTNFVGEYYAN